MDKQHHGGGSIGMSRRTAVSGMAVGAAAAAALFARSLPAPAQEAAPEAGQCVAMAPPTEEGVGFASLLVGGIIHDMPPGAIEVRISRFTLEPGAGVPAAAMPYPSLMVIETGESSCPGGPGKIMYSADGTVLGTSNGKEPHLCPTGTTWYIPAGIPDGADNEGTDLMSSIILEFVPVAAEGTPAGA